MRDETRTAPARARSRHAEPGDRSWNRHDPRGRAQHAPAGHLGTVDGDRALRITPRGVERFGIELQARDVGQRFGALRIGREAAPRRGHRRALAFELLHTRETEQCCRIVGRSLEREFVRGAGLRRVILLEKQRTTPADGVDVAGIESDGPVEGPQRGPHRFRIADTEQYVRASRGRVFRAVPRSVLLIRRGDAACARHRVHPVATREGGLGGCDLRVPAVRRTASRALLLRARQRRHRHERHEQCARMSAHVAPGAGTRVHRSPPAALMACVFSAMASSRRSSSAS